MSDGRPPLCPYLRFVRYIRPIVRQEHPEMSFGQLGKEIGKRWKELAEAEKKPYQEAYEAEKREWDAANLGKNSGKCGCSSKVLDSEKQETE